MDKSKSRTDMLAAGRKKLQQFRKKKDKKGSSNSHGRSSGKTSKPDNDDDTEEPSRVPELHLVVDGDEPSTEQSNPSVFAKPVDSLSVPGAENKGDQEELPPISLDHQEASNSGYEECNGERLEKKSNDIDGIILATYSERSTEELAAFSSSGLKMVQKMDGSSFQCEMSRKDAQSPSFFNKAGNEKDWKQNSGEDHVIQKGGMNEETVSSSFLAEELQEAGANLSAKPEERALLEENLEVLPLSHAMLSTNSIDGVAVVDAEVERINNQGYKVADSVKAEGTTSHEDGSVGLHSSQDFLDIEGVCGTRESGEEGGRRHVETIILQYGTTEEEIGASIPDKVLKVDNTNLSFVPEESFSVEETSKTISSLSQGISDIEGADGAVVAEDEGVRRNNTVYIKQTDRTQKANVCSISGEVLHEANTNLLDKPKETSYVAENLETVTSSTEDIPASKEDDIVVIAVSTEEERTDVEGSFLQSFLGKNATAESLENCSEQRVTSSAEGFDKGDSHVWSSKSEIERIKQLLYVTIIEKDVLQLQLDEQIALNDGNQQQSFDEVTKLRNMMKEIQDSYAVVNAELEQCRSGLQAMSIAKEELETQCFSTREEMEELRTNASELQSKLNQSQEGLQQVLVELAYCRASLETLQKENMELAQSLIFEKDATKNLMEEKEFLSSENNKLASEVVEQKQQLFSALDKQVDLQSNLRDAVTCFDQLAEENVYLASSLDVHETKIKEFNERQLNEGHLNLSSVTKNSGNQGMCLLQKQAADHGNSVLFGGLKQQLDEANNLLHNLEKSVDDMLSHTVSIARSSGRVAAPGISKIIQAFESKVHNVDNISDDVPPFIEGGHPEVLYSFTKQQTCSLRDILKQMEVELAKFEIHVTKEQNIKEYLNKFLVYSEIQNEQKSFQERIDELVEKVSGCNSKIVVLQNHIDEIKQYANEGTSGLLTQVEKLQKDVNGRLSIFKQEEDSTRGAIIDAIEKLNASTKLQADDGLGIGSHFMASVDAAVLTIKSLHEKLQTAYFNYNTLKNSFEELNKSFVDLQATNGTASELLKEIYSSLRESVYDSCQGEVMMDVNADEFLQLLPRNCDLLIGQLRKLMDERHRLLSTNNELEVRLLNRNKDLEELNMRYDALLKKLEDEYRTKEGLESVLMNRSKSFDEVSNKVLSLVQKLEGDELRKDLEGVPKSMKSDNVESDFCMSTLLRLEALLAFHLQNHEEVIKQIDSSKTYLREVNIVNEISADNWSLPLHSLLRQEFVPKLCELKEKLGLLSVSNLQQKTEIQILREGLSKTEEALETCRFQLNMKLSELEQSEQRLSSVREKLSIAVAKGKGLIVQRDSLKQSLIEKSSELEKCMQELQSKVTLLHEVEAKLKSCSEVDRVEALESELSYIRDSATALRDSFLLKDSVLQRIEEVLEDLDLPEHFHSKDVVEKIELLSRLVAGNSSVAVTDWDQKSFEGRSHSDAGFLVMDNWKDDIQTSSKEEFDDLKRKYEELQSKFYGLAEHNDMLQQSLLERNSLVQKWEEMLDRIDMPSHLRMLEPEDRIECLGAELSEIQQERDALQLKIENLEVSSDMLIVDLEESHKKISELSAEVVTVKSEKDFFSESLEKLRFQYLALSEKAVHDEVERENFQRELVDVQEKLAKKVEDKAYHDIENELQKLHDVVLDALPNSDNSEAVSGLSGFASLEALIRKLIDNYTIFSLDKSKYILNPKEANSEGSKLSLDKQLSFDVHDKDQELLGLRLELEVASQNLVLAKEERDAALEKCDSLTSQLDEVTRQMNLLQEERNHDMEKHQSLVLELEGLILAKEERDATLEKCHSLALQIDEITRQMNLLQEERNHDMEKHKSLVLELEGLVLLREERDAALEKCHSLTLQIDEITIQMNLLQEERSHDMEKYQSVVLELQGVVLVKEERDAALEKCHSLALELDEITRQINLLKEEKTHDMEKHQSLMLELEAVSKHRDALQEQLIQEEQKSSAVREKLNVAVRKGKGLVQQRDALKQTIEEMKTMVEHLKVEHNHKVETLESENTFLMNQLAEIKLNFEECTQNLSRLLAAVHSIDIDSEVNVIDPVQKIEEIGKISHDLHLALVSSQQEAKKSKQAAELLLVELNEVQDRVDILQGDLEKAEAALTESYQQKHDAEAAKVDAFSRLEQFMSVNSEERKMQINNLIKLMSSTDQLRRGCIGFSSILSDFFRKDAYLISHVQSFLESLLKQMNGENVVDLPVLGSSNLFTNPTSEVKSYTADDACLLKVDSHFGDNLIAEHLNRACCYLHDCVGEFVDLEEKLHKYLFSINQQETCMLEILETVKQQLGYQKEYSEALKQEVTSLEQVIKEKETQISSMQRNVSCLYEACRCSIVEIENRKAGVVQGSFASEGHVSRNSSKAMELPSDVYAEEHADGYIVPYTDQSIRTMAESLLSSIQRSTTNNETKATITELQRELQEKDIEMNRISEELVSQIRDAELVAKRSLSELDSARARIFSLEKKVFEMENDKQLLESRISELKDCEASLQALQDKFKSLTDSLAAKDQEIEGLMQALDEEETQMETLENRNRELQDLVQEKILALENLESSKAKAVAKLSTTVTKFDELHNLSENLLAEIERLESQLQESNSEISFLRQEVTRYTNNDLASQETNKKYLSEINEVLMWMEMMVSRLGEPHRCDHELNFSQLHVYTDILEKRITSVMNELEDLRVTAQSNDTLLQMERSRVEEILHKSEDFATIHQKEIQREPFKGENDSVQPSSSSPPRHVETEQMVQRNKLSSAPIVTHIRSGRKVNNDQVAIAIDMEKDLNVLDDEDDDKAHGFKSLTMSRLVPRATRPISDRIDGIWVSAERLLMRQPSLRLGVILYWVLLHALLASII